MEIIPLNCLSFLPFIPEELAAWGDASDTLRFLRCLFGETGTISDEDGTELQLNNSDYGRYLFKNGKRQIKSLSTKFSFNARKAKAAPAAEDKIEPIPDFLNDKEFGRMAKSYLAWSGTVNQVLSESAFFSIEHVLESESELDCSVLLASNLYYKQALQILRNFLEGIVLQLYLCDNEAAFANWKADSFRVPSFRDKKKGMLENLSSRGVLPRALNTAASNLYERLNGSIHGSEKRLINRGVFTGNWLGLIFKYDYFKEWCQLFSRVVEVAIPVLRININMWERILEGMKSGIRCSICHNVEDFICDDSDATSMSARIQKRRNLNRGRLAGTRGVSPLVRGSVSGCGVEGKFAA